MPRTEVVFYCDDNGSVPVLEWLDGLPLKARLKCLDRVERLRELGHELRRPEADFLRDGIHELRISLQHVQYRLLYAFHTGPLSDPDEVAKVVKKGSRRSRSRENGGGRELEARRMICVVAHGITKEGKVPSEEIARALARMKKWTSNPDRYTYRED